MAEKMNPEPESKKEGENKLNLEVEEPIQLSEIPVNEPVPVRVPVQEELPVEAKLSGKKKRLIKMVKGAAGIKSKPNPFLPENSLSAIERYFHHMPKESAQVVLLYGGRIQLPKGSKILSVDRLVDVMKLTAAEVYRTASVLDYDSHIFTPMGNFASELRLTHRFTPLEDESTFAKVAQKEVNQKYDMQGANSSLWNIHIVGPEEMLRGIIEPEDAKNFEFPKFYIYWSFHHCISDGLSGWAFIRKFMSKMGAENFQIQRPLLDSAAITNTPPPLIDNLIKTNWVELLPAYIDAICQLFAKIRFKKMRLKSLLQVPVSLDNVPDLPDVVPKTATNVRFFSFDAEFSEALRLNCRKNKTTIASAVIVAALSASRSVFAPKAAALKRKMPSYQAWVVTSSTRHLIPNSRLLEGADKEVDPALMEFGGYGGSFTSECFKFGSNSDMWERCRAVKGTLSSSFLKSMRRMKLMNFLFRRQSLWKKLQAKVDLQDITRSYSVEVANLGSWNTPYAPSSSTRTDLATSDWFAGSLNNSFHGARALFTVALISINNVMSFTVSYDMSTISQQDGDLFVAGITKALTEMKLSSERNLYVKSLEQ